MRNIVSDISLKYKLSFFGLVCILAILVVVGTGWRYYQDIQRISAFRDEVHDSVKEVQDIRVLEKAYLQFYTPALKEDLRERTESFRQELDELAERTDRANWKASIQAILERFVAYQSQLDRIISIHNTFVDRTREMRTLLAEVYSLVDETIDEINAEQFEAQMMGEELSSNKMEMLSVSRDVKLYLLWATTLQQRYLMSGDADVLSEYQEYIAGDDARALTAFEQFAISLQDKEKTVRAGILLEKIDQFKVLAKSSQDLFLEDKTVARLLDQTGQEIIGASEELLAGASEATDSIQSRAARSISIIVLVAVLLCVLIALGMIRSITRPLNKSVQFARAVARGDFSHDLDIQQKDETGRLADALRTMVENLQAGFEEVKKRQAEAEEHARKADEALKQAEEAGRRGEAGRCEGMLDAADKLGDVVETLTSASASLNDRVQTVRRGAETQEERVSHTVTAMEQMNATVMEVAQNASDAAEGAATAKTRAMNGEQVVEQAIGAIGKVDRLAKELEEAMDELGEQAQSIGHIMNVISDIADQTNLLALNAAIEAARAGEAGRGFAVVADEVRKLAEKTMSATQEVGKAIGAIQKGTSHNVSKVKDASVAVDEATRLANESGEALREIVGLVDNTSGQVQSIASAAEEQSASSEEINRSVEEINRISTEISEGMGESADAVADLTKQADNLKRIINGFQEEGERIQNSLETGT